MRHVNGSEWDDSRTTDDGNEQHLGPVYYAYRPAYFTINVERWNGTRLFIRAFILCVILWQLNSTFRIINELSINPI